MPTSLPDSPVTAKVPPRITKVILAVHGIGDQTRNQTIRDVANRFGSATGAPISLPIGFFSPAQSGKVEIKRLAWPRELEGERACWGFAEVYWADRAAKAEEDQHTLERAQAWASTVVARTEARFQLPATERGAAGTKAGTPGLSRFDAGRVRRTLVSMIETIDVLENLLFILRKAGIFDFELKRTLDAYLGDVQLVTDFPEYREAIVACVREASEAIHEQAGDAEIYVIAHSEGTVVSLLGLLEGLREGAPWAAQVRGLVTLGSPLDKHLALWPELWTPSEPRKTARQDEQGRVVCAQEALRKTFPKLRQPRKEDRIRWYNYYDRGDPVGFDLDAARAWLGEAGWDQCFDFDEKADYGFARYLLPGAAHNDYWGDEALWEHCRQGVLQPAGGATAQPLSPLADVRWRSVVGTSIPYAIAAACLLGGCGWLTSAVCSYAALSATGFEVLRIALGIAFLLGGMTLVVRLPRLGNGKGWQIGGWCAFLAGMVGYVCLISPGGRARIGSMFLVIWERFAGKWSELGNVVKSWDEIEMWPPTLMPLLPTLGVLGFAVVVVTVIKVQRESTSRRWLIGSGVMMTVALVAPLLFLSRDGSAKSALVSSAEGPSLWPVLIGAGGFLYLWWLGILILDLAFTWHQYIRSNRVSARFSLWYREALNQGRGVPAQFG